MTEEKLVEEILEIASELDRGDITLDEAQTKAETLVRIDRYEQLISPDVVQQSELYTCDCKVCGKPFGDKLSLYEHYNEEHN